MHQIVRGTLANTQTFCGHSVNCHCLNCYDEKADVIGNNIFIVNLICLLCAAVFCMFRKSLTLHEYFPLRVNMFLLWSASHHPSASPPPPLHQSLSFPLSAFAPVSGLPVFFHLAFSPFSPMFFLITPARNVSALFVVAAVLKQVPGHYLACKCVLLDGIGSPMCMCLCVRQRGGDETLKRRGKSSKCAT